MTSWFVYSIPVVSRPSTGRAVVAVAAVLLPLPPLPLPPPPPPPPVEKPLASYWLFGRSEQGASLLGLLLPHLRGNGLTAGASLAEAKQAAAVTIVGGEDAASAADEQALLAAGCRVERLSGDPFALAEALLL